jgi:hypothetical protein
MAHFVHVEYEMGRDPLNLLDRFSEKFNDLFFSDPQSASFHQDSGAGFQSGIPSQHMPSGCLVHGQVDMLLEIILDVTRC